MELSAKNKAEKNHPAVGRLAENPQECAGLGHLVPSLASDRFNVLSTLTLR